MAETTEQTTPKKTRRLTRAELEARAVWEVEIEEGLTVKVRRIDLIKAFMTGIIPTPLLAALGRLASKGKALQTNPALVAGIPEEDREGSLELLQRYVCAAVIDPIFVMEDDGENCPVSMLTADQLLAIWTSGPPKVLPTPHLVLSLVSHWAPPALSRASPAHHASPQESARAC